MTRLVPILILVLLLSSFAVSAEGTDGPDRAAPAPEEQTPAPESAPLYPPPARTYNPFLAGALSWYACLRPVDRKTARDALPACMRIKCCFIYLNYLGNKRPIL